MPLANCINSHPAVSAAVSIWAHSLMLTVWHSNSMPPIPHPTVEHIHAQIDSLDFCTALKHIFRATENYLFLQAELTANCI